MNLIARLEFELAYYDVTVQHVSHYATGTLAWYHCFRRKLFFYFKNGRGLFYLWFCLVSLFNGISTFVGYSLPKPSL